MRRFVPAKLHGMLDFATAGLVFCGPEVFRVRDSPPSSTPARAFGVVVMVLSTLTDYGPTKGAELGGLRLLSIKTHLKVDAVCGATILVLPWVTGSYRKGWNYWAPQMLLGTSELFFSQTTKVDPEE
jgi:hypothetical protein